MKPEKRAIVFSIVLLSIASIFTSVAVLFSLRKKNKYAELPIERYYRLR